MKQNKICLYGLPCTGKSFSIATLFKIPDIKVLYLVTERNAFNGLEQGLKHYKINLKEDQLYTCVVKRKGKLFINEFNALQEFVKKSHQEAQVDKTDANKSKYKYFLDICMNLMNFKVVDYVSGKELQYGNIGELSENIVLVVDGLTQIVDGIWENIKGDRVISQQADYGTVQFWLRKVVNTFIDSPASVILLAHAERHIDDFEKIEKIRVALNAGIALNAPFLGYFQNGIYAYRTNDDKFRWAGKRYGTDTAARDIPLKEDLIPDFSLYPFFN